MSLRLLNTRRVVAAPGEVKTKVYPNRPFVGTPAEVEAELDVWWVSMEEREFRTVSLQRKSPRKQGARGQGK